MQTAFISHNFRDKPLARKISANLGLYGVKCWIDESEIKLGDSLIEKIREGIDNGDYLIALISKNSISSEWVKKELDVAMNQEIEGKKVKVIPILAGDCELPGFLKGKLYADMSTDKKFKLNLASLLNRFNIIKITEPDKLKFTSDKLSVVEVIDKMKKSTQNELEEFVESFSYSDRNIFEIDIFKDFINEYISKNYANSNLILSVLSLLTPKDVNLKKIDFSKLLQTDNESILEKSIIALRNTSLKTKYDDQIFEIMKAHPNSKGILKQCCMYFGSTYITDTDLKSELIEYCDLLLETNPPTKSMVDNIVSIYFKQDSNDNLEKIIDLWNISDNKRRDIIIQNFCHMDTDIYISNPRVRDEFKNILLKSIREKNEIQNSAICIKFLLDESEQFFSSVELWGIINALDDYSIIAFLDSLLMEYNIPHVFSDIDNLNGLSILLDRNKKEIVMKTIDIIAEITSKTAIDILIAHDYKPKRHNSSDIIMTLLKETNINDYIELYTKSKDELLKGYYGNLETILISICDYAIEPSNISELTEVLTLDTSNQNGFVHKKSSMLSLICEYLTLISNSLPEKDKKAVQKFLANHKLH
ncbi:toll/interleukin-1 receptor domain-containing protein [Paenibacillus sp. SI92]